ncbi:hypothetical protein HDV04_003024 [Boothiomyces sp. JEL0838]|nr:hypothetical protein HDV04_003024 [Boothiomyces sp. JEL0838]
MKKLAVRIGTSVDSLELINPNDEGNPTKIESAEFHGFAVVRIKNFSGVHPSGTERIEYNPYFEGKKHMFSLHIQGKFLKDWDANEIVWASQWDKPINIPALFIKFWHMIAPHAMSDLSGPKPYFQSYAVTSSSLIQTWEKEPDNFVNHIQEDLSNILPSHLPIKRQKSFLFGSEESNLVASRRRILTVEENRKSVKFPAGRTIAFETFNTFFDPNNFHVRIPGTYYDLQSVLGDQPLRMYLRSKDGSAVFVIVELSLE